MEKQGLKFNKTSGFSLIELLVTLAILAIIVVAATSVFIYGPSSYSRQFGNISAQNQARNVMRHISKDIRKVDQDELVLSGDGLKIADKLYRLTEGKVYRGDAEIARGVDEFSFTFNDNHLFVQIKISNMNKKQYTLQSDFYIRGEGQ